MAISEKLHRVIFSIQVLKVLLIIVLQMLVIFGTPFVGYFGYFKVYRYAFMWKLIAGALFYFAGPSSAWLLIAFFLCDR